MAPSTLGPHFGTGRGSGVAPLGVHRPVHHLPAEDKGLTFLKQCRKQQWCGKQHCSFVPWEDRQLSTSKTVLRLIFIAALLRTGFFCTAKFGLRGPVRTMRAVMQHEVRLSEGVRRVSSEPARAIRKAPMEVEGWDLPPWVIRPSFLCSIQALVWDLQVVLQHKK